MECKYGNCEVRDRILKYNRYYYQQLVYNLLDTLEYVADGIVSREDKKETEDFIDMVSNTIMEFGEITPEMKNYLEERGYGQRE